MAALRTTKNTKEHQSPFLKHHPCRTGNAWPQTLLGPFGSTYGAQWKLQVGPFTARVILGRVASRIGVAREIGIES